MTGDALQQRLVERIAHRDRSRPFRLGVDGPCGVGETRFGQELADTLDRAGEPVLHLDSDAFHHVSAVRRRRTDDPARGYYEDAYDLDGLAEHVLKPLGSGRREVRTALCDFDADQTVATTARVAQDTVVVYEGTFIQRGSLRELWDLVIHLSAAPAVARARAVARDARALGGQAAAALAHEQRYGAAWDVYEHEQRPEARADVLIDHSDPRRPVTLRW